MAPWVCVKASLLLQPASRFDQILCPGRSPHLYQEKACTIRGCLLSFLPRSYPPAHQIGSIRQGTPCNHCGQP